MQVRRGKPSQVRQLAATDASNIRTTDESPGSGAGCEGQPLHRGTQELLRPQSLANAGASPKGERLLRKADRHHAPRVPRLCYSAWRETPSQLTEGMDRALQSIAPTFEPWSWNPGALGSGLIPCCCQSRSRKRGAYKYPPAEPEVLRLLAPQRGLIAIG